VTFVITGHVHAFYRRASKAVSTTSYTFYALAKNWFSKAPAFLFDSYTADDLYSHFAQLRHRRKAPSRHHPHHTSESPLVKCLVTKIKCNCELLGNIPFQVSTLWFHNSNRAPLGLDPSTPTTPFLPSHTMHRKKYICRPVTLTIQVFILGLVLATFFSFFSSLAFFFFSSCFSSFFLFKFLISSSVFGTGLKKPSSRAC